MIQFFIQRPKLGILLSLIFIFAGLSSLLMLQREPFPTVDFATAKILTIYPGATPEDVEELVTQKIEDELREIEGLREVRSISQYGRSEILIRVDLDNADVAKTMDEIQRATQRVVDLPAELEDPPLFEELKTQNFPVLEIAIVGTLKELELRDWADRLEELIESHTGVAGVDKVGFRDREFHVLVDHQKMKAMHVSFFDVVNAIQKRNLDVSGGIFESSPFEKTIRVEGEVSKASQLQDTVVRTNRSGTAVLLSDIALVKDSFEEPVVMVKSNGQKSIVLVVRKKENADMIRLSDDIKEILADFKKDFPKAKFIITNDEATRTQARLDIVISNSIIGFILILASLLLFLSWRMAVLASLSMPIIVTATLFVMVAMGITFNLISMLAIIIALGMFVDNSIVVSENIHRYQEEGLSAKEAAQRGVSTIVWPITATVFTTIAAFAPMMVTKGIMGEFIFSIPVLVSLSLIICLAESFFLLPSRILIFGGRQKPKQKEEKPSSHWFEFVQRQFERVLRVCVRFKWTSVLMANLLLFGAFFWAGNHMKFILFPAEGVDVVVVKYEAKRGVPIEKVHEALLKLEQEVLKLESTELKAVVSRTGIQQLNIDDPEARTATNVGMMTIYLTPEIERERMAAQIIDQLKSKVSVYDPFVQFKYIQIINGPPIGRPITVTFLGNQLDELNRHSQSLISFLKQTKGVFDVDTDYKPGLRQIGIKLKPQTTARYGVSTSEIGFALRSAFEGAIASRVTYFGEEIDVRVKFNDSGRSDFEVLKDIQIPLANGQLVPLEKMVEFSEVDGPRQRRHLNFFRSITVTADLDTEILTSVDANQLIREKFADFEKNNPGYRIKFGGEEESTNESVTSLMTALVIAVFCIYAILVTLFNSLSKPMLVMFSIPFGFIGTILGFSIHDKPLGFMALIGSIGLAGVVVNASIVMISFIDQIHKEQNLSFTESLIKGASLRLRPVLLTTLTTVAALIPTAYGVGGWDPLLVPMTMALAWGLLFGTILTLFIIPCSYAVLKSIQDFFKRIKKRLGRLQAQNE